MRGALLLLLGFASGIVGAVLLFTIAGTFDPDGPDDSGGGNARVEIHEDALATLIGSRVGQLVSSDVVIAVTVAILDTGRLEIEMVLGDPALGGVNRIELNPEVVEGSLQFAVVFSELDGLPQEAQTVAFLTGPLYTQMDALAGGLPYRLVAITTRNGKLTLDIVV
jgi:hypothetical protein